MSKDVKDYTTGYSQGFREGFKEGYIEGVNSVVGRLTQTKPEPPMVPTPYNPGTPWELHQYKVCPTCGYVKNPLSVCQNLSCPLQSYVLYKTKTTNNTSGN